MATVMNDRDVLLQAAQRETDPRANRYLAMAVDTPFFRVGTDGSATPSVINFSTTPINIPGGTVQFSAPAGATLTVNGNNASLAFSAMTVDNVTITAAITYNGQTFTATQVVTKVQPGTQGKDGTPGAQFATVNLYQWSTAQPSLPTGHSTVSWNVGANTSYTGTDNWYITPPANPGTVGVQLWVAQKSLTVSGGTQTTDVTYSAGATLFAVSANGAQGLQGVAGVTTTIVRAYQWANGSAPTAVGSATYTWSKQSYNMPPTNWSILKPNAPALGYTLYEADIYLVQSSGVDTSAIDWSQASISPIGYMPTNGTGTKGDPGSQGASAVIAYTLIDGSSLNQTPLTFTASGQNLPTTGTWGETRAWQSTPPSPGVNQAVFQSNGVYNPAANGGAGSTVWGVPYLSNLRVGNLSALSTNTGSLTVSGTISSANGNFTVDSAGNATMKSVTIKDSSGNTILSSGTALNPAYAAAGTLNSAITINANGTLSGAGSGGVTIGGLGYTGALNATYGATLGTNVGGQISTSNISSLIAAGAIGSTYISDLAASKITAGTLVSGVVYAGSITANQISSGTIASNVVYAGSIGAGQITAGTLAAGVVYAGTISSNQISANGLTAISARINGTLSTRGGSGGGMDISDNVLKVFDDQGRLRVKLGNLSL